MQKAEGGNQRAEGGNQRMEGRTGILPRLRSNPAIRIKSSVIKRIIILKSFAFTAYLRFMLYMVSTISQSQLKHGNADLSKIKKIWQLLEI